MAILEIAVTLVFMIAKYLEAYVWQQIKTKVTIVGRGDIEWYSMTTTSTLLEKTGPKIHMQAPCFSDKQDQIVIDQSSIDKLKLFPISNIKFKLSLLYTRSLLHAQLIFWVGTFVAGAKRNRVEPYLLQT